MLHSSRIVHIVCLEIEESERSKKKQYGKHTEINSLRVYARLKPVFKRIYRSITNTQATIFKAAHMCVNAEQKRAAKTERCTFVDESMV